MLKKVGAIGLLLVPAILPAPKAEVSPAAERALLDQYCVVCHNEKLKTANLSLQSADINSVADHPEDPNRVSGRWHHRRPRGEGAGEARVQG